MSDQPASRADLYRVAAFLRGLDRMLHPARCPARRGVPAAAGHPAAATADGVHRRGPDFSAGRPGLDDHPGGATAGRADPSGHCVGRASRRTRRPGHAATRTGRRAGAAR